MELIPIIIGTLRTVPKGWKLEDHPDYNTVEIDQNIEVSPEDQRRLAVTQIAGKDH